MTLAYAYDNAGRLTSQTHNGAMPVAYDYDEASNVAHITHPDGFVARFTYDALNRVERVRQVNSPGDTGYIRQFAHTGYDRLSRRSFLHYLPNSFATAAKYGYTPRGDLTCLDWNFTGTRPSSCDTGAPEVAYDMAYNPVGQLISETVSDLAYRWSPAGPGTDTYVSNGLNQYASINGVNPTYDGNGNMTEDVSGRGFTYDAENVLRHVEDAGAATIADYAYYADGARSKKIAGGATSKFYHAVNPGMHQIDGEPIAQEIIEYNGANVERRYIRLPGSVDEVILMIDYTESTGCTNTSDDLCQRWVHQKRNGSVVAVTDSGGNVVEQYTYSPYGVSGGSPTGFPFRFTGQKLDPETGLYYYKARYYDPETGRFMQTDPIGYEDQQNLYAYVGNDPVNKYDTSGKVQRDAGGKVKFVPDDYDAPYYVRGADPNENNGLAEVTPGKIYADDGREIRAFKNNSGQRGMDCNCHGWTFGDGEVWIDPGEVDSLLEGDGYSQVDVPEVGDVAIYRDSSGNPVHSAIVTSVDPETGEVTVEGVDGRDDVPRSSNPGGQGRGRYGDDPEYYRK